MKICYLAPSDSIHTTRWVNFFAERGNEIHLIFFEKPLKDLDPRIILHPIRSHYKRNYYESDETNHEKEWNFKTRTLLNYFLGYLPFIPKLLTVLDFMQVRKEINKIRPDIVHAHFLTTYGLLGILADFHPICTSVWGSDILIDSRGTMKYISRWILRKSDVVTCDGENTLNAILDLGIPQNKIYLICHGIDVNKFSPSFRDPAHMERIFGRNSPVVICIRGLYSEYDPETFIRAIPQVLEKIPNVNFLIAGNGPEEQRIKNIVNSLNISAAIKFIGIVPHDVIPVFLSSSDIYVSVSLSDGGVAISTFEAMACGVPPIVTDVGDNNKWITTGENGFIIPIRSPECLAEKIIYLLNHPEERSRFGTVNRTIVTKNQDYYKEMEKVYVLYKSLVKR